MKIILAIEIQRAVLYSQYRAGRQLLKVEIFCYDCDMDKLVISVVDNDLTALDFGKPERRKVGEKYGAPQYTLDYQGEIHKYRNQDVIGQQINYFLNSHKVPTTLQGKATQVQLVHDSIQKYCKITDSEASGLSGWIIGIVVVVGVIACVGVCIYCCKKKMKQENGKIFDLPSNSLFLKHCQ